MLEIFSTFSHYRKYYDGSVMLFKKELDHLIYSECEEEYNHSEIINIITNVMDQIETGWHLLCTIYSYRFDLGTPVVQAICSLFDQTQCEIVLK